MLTRRRCQAVPRQHGRRARPLLRDQPEADLPGHPGGGPAADRIGPRLVINLGAVVVEQPTARLPATAALAGKGGVHVLTRSLAIELAARGVRVNAIAPGIIRTPLIGDGADGLTEFQPLGRVGEPRESTDAAVFLARASFVTGVILDVDGGYGHGR